MARTTFVKKAQQRYETVTVLDEDGSPKKTPVMRRDGTQKTTKRGKPVFMTVTVVDKTKPKPPYTCDSCGKPIEIGTPYKHITPKSGPYGGHKRTRHAGCPTWQVWEYSSSLSARLAQVSFEFEQAVDSAESPDDVTEALSDAAASVKEIAEEKREGATNIEDGFGHETSQSQELNETADNLETWAEEIESADVPELPDLEDRYFVTNGDGVPSDLFEEDGYETEADAVHALAMHREDNNADADEPDDGFEIEAIAPEEPTEEQMDEWRDEVRSQVTIVDESPV